MDLPSDDKQLEDWIKYMKELFSDTGVMSSVEL